jgi:hypothetical protein
MISVEMANLEIALGDLLAALLHIDRHFGRVVYLTPQSAIGRLHIVENVVEDHLVKDTDGYKHLKSAVKTAKRRIGKRHEYIHNAWGVSPDAPTQIVRQSLPQRELHPPRTVALRELTDLIEEIRELADDINKTVNESFATWPPYTWRGSDPAPTGAPPVASCDRPHRSGTDPEPNSQTA